MSPLTEVGIIARRELTKNIRSTKGIALSALTLLGAAGLALAFAWVEETKKRLLKGASPEEVAAFSHQLVYDYASKAYGKDVGVNISSAPYVLVVMLGITVLMGPLLVSLIGFDSVSGEVQHRAVRFWTVRTRRASYYVGKALGIWSVTSLLTFITNLVMWGVVLTRGSSPVGDTLSWGFRFWLVSLPLSAAWCGISMLLSSQFRTPIVSLLVTWAGFFVLLICFLIGAYTYKAQRGGDDFGIGTVGYLYPNWYDRFLLSSELDQVFIGIGVLVSMAVLTTVSGALRFQRKDV